jgi:hypothetical protein
MAAQVNFAAVAGGVALPYILAVIIFIVILVLRSKNIKIYDELAAKTYGISNPPPQTDASNNV